MNQSVSWIKYHFTHLEFTNSSKPPFEQWKDEVVGSETRRRSDPWWRGDLYNQGVAWYGEDVASSIFDPDDWGEQSLKTFQNNASVCDRIDTSRRRERLSFSHHAEVAYLEPEQFEDPPRTTTESLQDYYLEIAVENKFSIRQLRDKIKFDRGNKAPPLKPLYERLLSTAEKILEWRNETQDDVYDLMTTAWESLNAAAYIVRDIANEKD